MTRDRRTRYAPTHCSNQKSPCAKRREIGFYAIKPAPFPSENLGKEAFLRDKPRLFQKRRGFVNFFVRPRIGATRFFHARAEKFPKESVDFGKLQLQNRHYIAIGFTCFVGNTAYSFSDFTNSFIISKVASERICSISQASASASLSSTP